LNFVESLTALPDILGRFSGGPRSAGGRTHRMTASGAMDTLTQVKKILGHSLNLGSRADQLTAGSALLGGLGEFDSMAVVSVVAALEEAFGITVDDDELSAEVFASVGTLTEFVSRKLAA
jgi:acyl carrier protein